MVGLAARGADPGPLNEELSDQESQGNDEVAGSTWYFKEGDVERGIWRTVKGGKGGRHKEGDTEIVRKERFIRADRAQSLSGHLPGFLSRILPVSGRGNSPWTGLQREGDLAPGSGLNEFCQLGECEAKWLFWEAGSGWPWERRVSQGTLEEKDH